MWPAPLRLLVAAAFAVWLSLARAAEPVRLESFTLSDQFGKTNHVDFPGPRPVLLLVGDRRGSEQVDDWIPLLRKHWGHDFEILGLADVSAAPRFLRTRITEAIRKSRPQPILLDFEGLVSRRLRGTPKVANLFLVRTNGEVAAHVDGPPSPEKLDRLRQAAPNLTPSAAASKPPPKGP